MQKGRIVVGRAAVLACVLLMMGCGPGAVPAGQRAAGEPGPAAQPPGGSSAGAPGSAAQPSGAAGGSAGQSDPLQSLVEAARQEGQLNLVWSQNSFGGAEGVRRWMEGFNRYYGLNLTPRYTPGPAPDEVATRVVQEYQSGRPAFSDVLLLGSSPLSGILFTDAVEPVDWVSWAPNVFPELVAPGGVGVEMSMRTPGITYNTQRVRPDEVPATLQDLLKPQYKGRIASTPYASGFDWMATPDFWGERRTLEFATRFADQIAGLIRCGEMERIASGEFDFLAMDCGGFEALKWQRKGAPLASTVPADVAGLTYWYMAVPRNAAHPAAAKLWINYLLTREAQDVLWELDAQDHYLVPGSKQASQVAELEARGVKPVQVDVEFFQRHNTEEMKRISAQVQRILQKQ
jgi:ABC-type Fe3+ transport system substrate-binding protein